MVGGKFPPRCPPAPNQEPHTLMDRSSSPKATMTLIGGRTRLDSWLSTVARMAFCEGKGGSDDWEQPGPTTPTPQREGHPPPPYLEEFKKHVVEVGRDIDHVNWLFGVGGCGESQDQGSENYREVTILHSFTQHLGPSTQPPIYRPTICWATHPAIVHPAVHSFGVRSTIYSYGIHPL